MTLKQQIIDDVEDVFLDTDEFGESITYTPTGGADVSILASVNKTSVNSGYFDDGSSDNTAIEVMIGREAVTGIENPVLGDQIETKDGAKYKVSTILNQDDATTFLLAARYDRVDATGNQRYMQRQQ
jgi:hypothetical protein